jgi:hypothetical protein
VRLGEDNIGASTTRRADVTGFRDIWPLTARFGLANASSVKNRDAIDLAV